MGVRAALIALMAAIAAPVLAAPPQPQPGWWEPKTPPVVVETAPVVKRVIVKRPVIVKRVVVRPRVRRRHHRRHCFLIFCR